MCLARRPPVKKAGTCKPSKTSSCRRRFSCSIPCKTKRSSDCRKLRPCIPGKKNGTRGFRISTRWRTGGRRERPSRRRSRRLRRRHRWSRPRPPSREGRVFIPQRRCAISPRFRKSIKRFSASRRRARCSTRRSPRWELICRRRAPWQLWARRAGRRKWPRNFAPRE